MSKIVIAILALLMSGWVTWEYCSDVEFSKMTWREKIKYAIVNIVLLVFLYVSWSNIRKISIHMRIVNVAISIFMAIVLTLGNIPIKIGFRGFKNAKGFIEFYLEDIIFCIFISIFMFSLLINLTIAASF